MNRIKAATIHFAISVTIITGFLAFVYFIWYDQIYAALLGLIKPLSLLVSIDVLLGPLLTLLVYKKDKKLLKLDLSLIVLLQVAAFSYGAYTCYMGKPTLLVMKKDAFEVVIENEINRDELSSVVADQLSFFAKPQYGYIPADKANVFKMAYLQQADVEHLTFDLPLMAEKEVALVRALDLLKLNEAAVADQLNLVVGGLNQVKFYLISHDAWFAILVVDQATLQPIKILYPPDNT